MDPELVQQQKEEEARRQRRKKDPSSFSLGYERNEADYYPTPKSLRALLTEHYSFPEGLIWEPCSGGGHLAKSLEAEGHKVLSTDLREGDDIYGTGGVNFLSTTKEDMVELETMQNVTSIVTNPPFNLLTKFMEKGLELLDDPNNNLEQLVLLARQDHHFSAKRMLMFSRAYRSLHSTWRAIWVPGTTGNPRWSHVWWEWKAGYNGPPAMIWAPRSVARENEFED